MKMVPNPDGRNADFYRLAASGRLYLQQCTGCRQYYHPPRYLCRECGSGELEFVPSEGRGRVFSWTVPHRGVDPGWAAERLMACREGFFGKGFVALPPAVMK